MSGEEKMRKPHPEFYQVLLDRFDVRAEEALFIDDSVRNIQAAKKIGIKTIHFTSPEQLRNELVQQGFL